MIPRFFIADQHWFCRSLQWFCNGGGNGYTDPHAVPEIHAGAFALAMGLVIFGTGLLLDYWRTKR